MGNETNKDIEFIQDKIRDISRSPFMGGCFGSLCGMILLSGLYSGASHIAKQNEIQETYSATKGEVIEKKKYEFKFRYDGYAGYEKFELTPIYDKYKKIGSPYKFSTQDKEITLHNNRFEVMDVTSKHIVLKYLGEVEKMY